MDILRPVQPTLKRAELDHLAGFHSLDAQGVESLLAIARARPSRAEGRLFLATCLRIGGLLSLAAGVVFFIAANWSDIAVFGRFALIELLLVVCGALAIWQPPPAGIGRGALFLAFVATGALLALFGQTYQTGADVYELFLTWALLGLPLALVARWSVTTAAWVLVLNLALQLYCGWQPAGGLLWILFGNSRFQTADLVMGAAWLNLLLWLAAEWRRPESVPAWVRRLLVSCAFLFATWAGVLSAVSDEVPYAVAATAPSWLIAPLAYLLALAVTIVQAMRRRDDIYPLAVVMGSFILVSLVWMAKAINGVNEGVFLLFAIYLIVASTAGGRVLLTLHRRWHPGGA
jgi:uncharacterized membrane protein